MKTNIPLVLLTSLIVFGCQPTTKQGKLTAINPLAYTDVTYIGATDTVIVSTYSGRLALRVNGQKGEQIIAQLDVEIYSILFVKSRNEIIVSTSESGILVIDPMSGEINKTIDNGSYWSNHLMLSSDETTLAAVDVKGNTYLWDVSKDYQAIAPSDKSPKGFLRFIGTRGDMYFTGGGKVTVWNSTTDTIIEYSVGGKLIDVDESGNLLLLNHNEVTKYDIHSDSILFSKKHPDWVFLMLSGDTVHIPLQMKLTTGITSLDKVFTAGIDRSIRVWNGLNGEMMDELIYHRATISSMDVSQDKTQLVSVDLRGGIKFWNIE